MTQRRPPGFRDLEEQRYHVELSPATRPWGCLWTLPQACSSRMGWGIRSSWGLCPGPYLLKLEAFWDWREKPSLFWDKPRNQLGPGLSWLGRLASSVRCRVCGPGLVGNAVWILTPCGGWTCPGTAALALQQLLAGPQQAQPEELTLPEDTSKYHSASRAQFCCQFSGFWYVTLNEMPAEILCLAYFCAMAHTPCDFLSSRTSSRDLDPGLPRVLHTALPTVTARNWLQTEPFELGPGEQASGEPGLEPGAHCPQEPVMEETPAQQQHPTSVCSGCCSMPRATSWDLRCGATEVGNLLVSDQACPWETEPSLVTGFPILWMVPARG